MTLAKISVHCILKASILGMFLYEKQWKFWTISILLLWNRFFGKQKPKTFSKKLDYQFLVESAKIENESFPYKNVTSEANVKTNRVLTTKWNHHKKRSLSTASLFWNFCFSLRTFYRELFWFTNYPNVHIHTPCKRWSPTAPFPREYSQGAVIPQWVAPLIWMLTYSERLLLVF